MAGTITQFRCLLISPGDVLEERDALNKTFTKWNAHIGPILGVNVELIRWETHATPEFGERPQEVLNEQIVDNSDLGIALFWSRLGTPTGEFRSGSVEEITRLGVAKKRLMVYFKNAAIPQESANEEFQRLRAFKEEMKLTAFFDTFDDVPSLCEKVSNHLSTAIAKLKPSVITELRHLGTNESADAVPRTAPRLVNLVDPFVYQMRYDVYKGLRAFIGKVMIDLKIDMEMIAQLHKLREDSEFLFGAEIVAYIREWIKYAAGMNVGRDVMNDRDHTSLEYQGWLKIYYEAAQYFGHQVEPLIDMFRPYLTIPLE